MTTAPEQGVCEVKNEKLTGKKGTRIKVTQAGDTCWDLSMITSGTSRMHPDDCVEGTESQLSVRRTDRDVEGKEYCFKEDDDRTTFKFEAINTGKDNTWCTIDPATTAGVTDDWVQCKRTPGKSAEKLIYDAESGDGTKAALKEVVRVMGQSHQMLR